MNLSDILATKAGQDPRNREALERTLRVSKAPAAIQLPVLQTASSPAKYFCEVPKDAIVCAGIIPGSPVPKQRARIGPTGGVTPQNTKRYQRQVADFAALQVTQPEARSTILGLRVIFYVSDHFRKDVDNMAKSLMDGLNGKRHHRISFEDDSQIKELMAWTLFDPRNPRTEFVLYRTGQFDSFKGGTCKQCGKTFLEASSYAGRHYCSRKCYEAHSRGAKEITCTYCGQTVMRLPSHTRDNGFCSLHCSQRAVRSVHICSTCGRPFTKPPSESLKSKSGLTFCSRSCYGSFKTGKPRRWSSVPKEPSLS